MDNLADMLAGSFQVTHYPNNPNAPHPRFADYKVKPAGQADQAFRRRKTLERQKEKRFDFMKLARGLTVGEWSEEDEDGEEVEDEGMDVEIVIRKPGRDFRNQLMLSEWMIERPNDLEENWFAVPCPVGKRSLIVASGGRTSVYAKSGYKVNKFTSLLPGGNRHCTAKHTILDGIFVQTEHTFYILDIMSWGNNHPVYDSETEFRLYWKTTKFQEIPELAEISGLNKYKMIPIPSYLCTKEELTQLMASPTNTELDGLLFYHKGAHYLFGPTPLVLWLKPYMLPEILGVEVPQSLMQQKPSDYINFAQHTQKVVANNELSQMPKQRGQGSPSRRRGGRHRRRSYGPPNELQQTDADSMEVTGSSGGSDGRSRGAPSGKGRGKGRGYLRGYGRGQYQSPSNGNPDAMEASGGTFDFDEDTQDLASPASSSRRRHERRRGGGRGGYSPQAINTGHIDAGVAEEDTMEVSGPWRGGRRRNRSRRGRGSRTEGMETADSLPE